MKKIISFSFLLIPFLLLAQIPAYYNDVNLSLSGIALKNELATKIISTHTHNLSYSNIWSVSKITDLDPNDPTHTKVILLYGYDDNDGNYVTDRTRSKNANGGNNGTDWNREHTYAKSLGNPNLGTSGPGSDAHHLRPADVSFNSQRSSKKFAPGSGHAGDSNGGWYPGDEWKGDVARMMMYMYLRYGNRCVPTGVGIGSSASTPDGMIDLFLQWNAEDPVSQIEKNRNTYHGNTANTYAQGNRNPFIDNPAFATQIWGGPQAEDLFGGGGNSDTQAPTAPTNLTASNTTQTATNLSWNASSDNVGVTGYNVYKNGTLVTTTTTTSYTVSGLTAATNYSFTIKAKDAAGNISTSSNTASITTQSGGGNGGGSATELFFSEYIEGSSYNKALEIANFTGASVNLANYKIKKQSNGSGGWSAGISLSGQLANNDVFVAANGNASSTIIAVADITSSGSELSFNGNDPIGLFKNGVLIDVIGNFSGGSANFAKDQTLRRKATVTSPNTTFNKSGEWDTFATNTFNGLGTHSISGGGNQDTQAPTTPTGLTASSIGETTATLSWNTSSDNVGVTGYNVYKNGTFLAFTANTSYNVTGLSVVTSYTFTVKAKDAANNISANSNTANVTTVDNTAPATPTNLIAANTTQTTTSLTWNTATDNVSVTGYNVYKNGSYLATTTANNYTVSGLTAATSYAFTVKAKDAANNLSNTSNTANVTTQSNGGGSSNVLLHDSFETGWNGWQDGGGDCYRIRSYSKAYDGKYSIRIRDNSGTASAMTSASFNVSAYNNLKITFNFYSYSMEYNEDFWVRFYDGATWHTVKAFKRGTDFNNYTFTAATVNISSANYNFPTNARFRFQCDASSNADQIYIDNVKIVASTGAAKSTATRTVRLNKQGNNSVNNTLEIEDMSISPNPATKNNSISVLAELDIEDTPIDVQLNIVNIQGQIVKTLHFNKVKNEVFKQKIDITNIESGLYFVNIKATNGFNLIKKLVIE